MNVIGIVVEYNPFHNGHKYQIDKIKEKYKDSIIIVCTTTSFTQRGSISIINKWDKTKLALENGVDIVVELPYIYSSQSSDVFASKSIELLNCLKIDTLCFGCESDNISNLTSCANTQLYDKNYDIKVKEYMDKGLNYPTSLNLALKDLINIEVKEPNDLLALSYIKEIIKNKYSIELFNIKRTNSYHDTTSNGNIVSSSNIREKLIKKENIINTVPKNVYEILKNKNISSKYFEYLKYKIISTEDLNIFVDVDEGLNKRIKDAIKVSNNIDELINNIKTKRYTYNKINRMLCHILCSFTKEENEKTKNQEYIRILGFTKKGQKYLNEIKKDINIDILNKYDTTKYKALAIEKRVSDIYSLIYEDITLDEIKNAPIIK